MLESVCVEKSQKFFQMHTVSLYVSEKRQNAEYQRSGRCKCICQICKQDVYAGMLS